MFDTIGDDVLVCSVPMVKPGGVLVSAVGYPPADRDDIRTVYFIREPNGVLLREIAAHVDVGRLRSPLGAAYPLADARAAFTAKASGAVSGKVVLQP